MRPAPGINEEVKVILPGPYRHGGVAYLDVLTPERSALAARVVDGRIAIPVINPYAMDELTIVYGKNRQVAPSVAAGHIIVDRGVPRPCRAQVRAATRDNPRRTEGPVLVSHVNRAGRRCGDGGRALVARQVRSVDLHWRAPG